MRICFSAFCFSLCAHLLGTPLRCLLMVITQQAAQSLAALNMPVAAGVRAPREQQDIALPLVIPFGMKMFDIFAQRSPQRALAKEDHLAQALLLHRRNLTFTADRRSLGQREGICYAENVVGLGFGDDAWVEWLRLVSGTCRASRASRSRGSKGR